MQHQRRAPANAAAGHFKDGPLPNEYENDTAYMSKVKHWMNATYRVCICGKPTLKYLSIL
eukprot:1158203-Pelagomonas_calceolata.AAC.8